jgi:phytoene synthase
MDNTTRAIFMKGSTTFFTSSLFFPAKIREDVFAFYAFVRVADDFVDATPQQKNEYYEFKKKYTDTLCGDPSGDAVIDNFIALMRKKGIETSWIEAFFASMEMDLIGRTYKTIDDTLEYIYGSAEIIGLVMAKILDLPPKSYETAKLMGRAFQYINFLRDIDEDIGLGRQYIPEDILLRHNIEKLSREKMQANNFVALMQEEIKRFFSWQRAAEHGLAFIPWRSRVAIKTAQDMYIYTANIILADPLIVFQKKVKPSKLFIIFTAVKNSIVCLMK